MVVLTPLPTQKPVLRLTSDLTTNVNGLLARGMADMATSLIINAFEEEKDVQPILCNNTLRQLAATSNGDKSFLLANNLILKCLERNVVLEDSVSQRAVIYLRDKYPLESLKLHTQLLDNDYILDRRTTEFSIVKLRERFPAEVANLILSAEESAKRGTTEDINLETIEITLNNMQIRAPKEAISLIKKLLEMKHPFSPGYVQRFVIGLDQSGEKEESARLLEQVLDKSFYTKTVEIAVMETRDKDPELAANILIKALDKDLLPNLPVVETTISVLRDKNSELALTLARKAIEKNKETYSFNPETINITLERRLTSDKINDTAENIIFFLDNNIFIHGGLVKRVIEALARNNSNDLALKLTLKSFDKGYSLVE